jgi:hypothetical protein
MFNWNIYVLFALLLRVMFPNMGWYAFLAIILSIYQFVLLFNSIGHIIPLRYLLGSFMCLQFFVGPALAYSGLDEYQYVLYRMRIPEEAYFLYAIPAISLFIIGLHINAGSFKGEILDVYQIRKFVDTNPKIPYLFIFLGLFSSIIGGFFGSDLAFVFYLLGGFKFIGLFLVLLSSRKVPFLILLITLASVVSTSLVEGMFHDLLTWIIFISCIAAIKYKFDVKIKIIGLLVFLSLAIVIQLLKGEYRSTISNNQKNTGLETFAKLAQKKSDETGFFNLRNIAEQNVRINQGFIITNIMTIVPGKEPYAKGSELLKLLEAALLPRILAPNKLKAGDKTLFTKYSGIVLSEGTSMALGSLGDGYINFGVAGGSIFMFLLGYMYGIVINTFFVHSKKYPILILFTALVFYYPIRPDCDLQTILGHLVKSCFLIFMMIKIWNSVFSISKKNILN